jgi:soluble lytic murein transglycosylase-like protein
MAERYGVDPEIYIRLIEKESKFDKNARGEFGELGYTQIRAKTAKDPGYGVTPIQDRLNPEDNLRFGAEYLGALVKHYDGDYNKALMAYNGGPTNVNRGSPSSAAQAYAAEILGGKQVKQPAPPAIVPQESEDKMTDYMKGIQALFGEERIKPLLSPRAPRIGTRFGKSSRMSPLSSGGDPMRKAMQTYMTPGGIESLYKRK